MTLDDFARRALDGPVPFVPHGRDYDGWDCWGLVWRGYRDAFVVALPSYTEDYASPDLQTEVDQLIHREMTTWREVDDVRHGDVALLRVGNAHCHVGLVIGAGLMLHVQRKIGTCVERLDSPIWRKRLVGIYRHE